MKFESDPNIIKLDEKIFWYKNFIPQDEVKQITDLLMSKNAAPTFFYEEMGFRTTDFTPELHPIWEKISELIYPDLVIHPLLNAIYFEVGKEMMAHCDSPGEDMTEELTVPDVWGTCCGLSYGAIVYFGEFSGGEVYYPNQNIEVPVQPGDLVIHGALASHMHGVRKVTEGHRFAYSNFAMKPEKNPGSFYNYKTPEYYEHIKNLTSWAGPLIENPACLVMRQDAPTPISK
jgi:hypothetical protein